MDNKNTTNGGFAPSCGIVSPHGLKLRIDMDYFVNRFSMLPNPNKTYNSIMSGVEWAEALPVTMCFVAYVILICLGKAADNILSTYAITSISVAALTILSIIGAPLMPWLFSLTGWLFSPNYSPLSRWYVRAAIIIVLSIVFKIPLAIAAYLGAVITVLILNSVIDTIFCRHCITKYGLRLYRSDYYCLANMASHSTLTLKQEITRYKDWFVYEANVKKNSLSFENEGDIAPISKNAVTARDLKLEREDIASEKDKRVTLTKKDFGKGILSYIVMLHGDSFEERLKDLEMKWDFVKYLTYIQYVVYISEKILETRFSTADSCEIAVSSFDGIVEYLDVADDDKKGAMAEVMKEQYLSFKEDINYGIYSEAELHSLVNAFLEDIDVGKGFICHSTFFLDFSSYIIHHTSSILDENIQIF